MPVKQKPFLSYVRKTDSCWHWLGAVSSAYGRYRHGGKSMKAHHVSWLLFRGRLPKLDCRRGGCVVMHDCDNKLCVNPLHLSLGTPTRNIRDAIARKRGIQWAAKRTARPHLHKFDRTQARTLRAAGHTWESIAKELGVCRASVQEALVNA